MSSQKHLEKAKVRQQLERIEQVLTDLGTPGLIAISDGKEYITQKRRLQFLVREAIRIRDEYLYLVKYKSRPVGIKEFVTGPYYLNLKDTLYPEVLRCMEEMNNGTYVEAVLTGGIGCGKTTIAVISTCYQLYLLSLMREPHKEFSLSDTDEIVLVFQSLNLNKAKELDYARFTNYISRSPYFINEFPWDKSRTAQMEFANRIIVKPISGDSQAAIGENVIGGVIDEINFMAMVEQSKRSADGGAYNQALDVYNTIQRRRESRFQKKGRLHGMLFLVSSKRYPGEFTDIKIAESRSNPSIYIYDKRVWEIKPSDTFTGDWFYIFTGDSTRKPKILNMVDGMIADDIPEEDRDLVMAVPAEYKRSFEADILGSLRDIAGVSTYALHPFIYDLQAVRDCFGRSASIISRNEVDFVTSSLQIYPNRFLNLDKQRFVHLDLAKSADSVGIACGYVNRFVPMQRGDMHSEYMPEIIMDFTLEVNPPKNGEINFEKIRALLYKLKEQGLPIKWVTADTYQSTDMIQTLINNGFMAGIQSCDTTTTPYDFTKSAIMDGRLLAPEHETPMRELSHLERDTKRNKIDHPPQGSKDVADAIAGVVFGLTMRREVWAKAGLAGQNIPKIITDATTNSSTNVDNYQKRLA